MCTPPHPVQLSDAKDELCWKWSKSDSYSASSVYKVMIEGGKIRWRYMTIWKCKAPPNAKLFAYLMLREKLLIHEVMMHRGFNCELGCQTCATGAPETLGYLLFSCPYVKEVWIQVAVSWGCGFISADGASLTDIWEAYMLTARRTRGVKIADWITKIICVCWHIWKQRNGKIFRGDFVPPSVLANKIIEESMLWEKFC